MRRVSRCLRELAQAALELGDAPPREAPVGLELRLARAARADAAAEPLEVLPHPAHPRQVVLELRELDLELALGAARVLGEDVEDQLRAVDDPRLEQVLEAALLRRVELVVDEQRLGAGLAVRVLQLLELALADVGARVRARRGCWTSSADGLDARRARELPDLGELLVGIGTLRQHGDDEPTLRIRPGGGIGLAMGHEGIMPAYAQSSMTRDLADDRRSSSSTSPPRAATRRRSRRTCPTRRCRSRPCYATDEALLFATEPHGAAARAARRPPRHRAAAGQPPRPDRGRLRCVGLGASDMKGGLAVMIELARWVARAAPGARLRPRLPLLRPRGAAGRGERAPARVRRGAARPRIEPRRRARADRQRDPRRLPRQPQRDGRLPRRERPLGAARGQGVNAIDLAVEGLRPVAASQPLEVEVGGLTFVEVLSATAHRRRDRGQRDPRPRRAYGSTTATRRAGRARRRRLRLRELVGAELEITSNSPPARVAVDSPLVRRCARPAASRSSRSRPGRPSREFAAQGLDAVNFGPGATRYAHRRDERVEIAELERTFDTLRRFVTASVSAVQVSPALSAQGTYPFVAHRAREARGRRGGRRDHRLRDGRPARADRPGDPAGARRRARGADGLPAGGGPARAARGDRGLVRRGGSASSSTRTPR